MITAPPGWLHHYGAHLLTLYPPEGGGRIRYLERMVPLRRASAILKEVLAQDPAYHLAAIGPTRRLVTAEGEYAAWIPTRGTRDGGEARHYLGIVFTDEFAAVLDTLAVVRPRFADLERISLELLQGVSLGLHTRRRRFLYDPPAGWTAMPSGLVANFYPPDFPDNRTSITVFPANPVSDSPQQIFLAALAAEPQGGMACADPGPGEPLESATGLPGFYFRATGGLGAALLSRDMVIFAADPYRYSLRLETLCPERLPEHRSIFRTLALSVQQVPQPGQPGQPGASDPAAKGAVAGLWSD